MKETKAQRIAFYADDDILNLCDIGVIKSNSKNRSKFICTAIKYYIAYLDREPNTEILTPIYEETIDKRLELTEHRLSKTLFKLAAEMAFTMNILAGAFKLDPDKVEIMKSRVVREVKMVNGFIDLKKIIEYQNGD